jgi:hypothetical protein
MKLNYFLTNKLLNLKITSTDKPFLTDDNETMTLTSLDDGEIQKEEGIYKWTQEKNIYYLTVFSDKYSYYETTEVNASQILIQQESSARITYNLIYRIFQTPGQGIYFFAGIGDINTENITWEKHSSEEYYNLTTSDVYYPNIWITSIGTGNSKQGDVVYNVNSSNKISDEVIIKNCLAYLDNAYTKPDNYRNINVRYNNTVIINETEVYTYEEGGFSNNVIANGTLTIHKNNFDTFILYETAKYNFKTLQIITNDKNFTFTISKPQGKNSQTFTGSNSYKYTL